MRKVSLFCLCLAWFLSLVTSFQILSTKLTPTHLRVGDSVRLMCKSDHSFEHCIWRHKDRVCLFEWKRNIDAVSKQTCTALEDRIDYVGHYNHHECEIRLKDLKEEDLGQWSCEMESYVFGPVRGSTDKKVIFVQIEIEDYDENEESEILHSNETFFDGTEDSTEQNNSSSFTEDSTEQNNASSSWSEETGIEMGTISEELASHISSEETSTEKPDDGTNRNNLIDSDLPKPGLNETNTTGQNESEAGNATNLDSGRIFVLDPDQENMEERKAKIELVEDVDVVELASSRGNIDSDTTSSDNAAIVIISILILVGVICFVAAAIVVHRRKMTEKAAADLEAKSEHADQEKTFETDQMLEESWVAEEDGHILAYKGCRAVYTIPEEN